MQSIESNFEGSLVTTLDLSNSFYSIELAAVYDLDQQYSDFIMKNSVISDPEPLEQNVDISHLNKYEKSLFLPLKDNY